MNARQTRAEVGRQIKRLMAGLTAPERKAFLRARAEGRRLRRQMAAMERDHRNRRGSYEQ